MRHKLSLSLPAVAYLLGCLLGLSACGPKFGDDCENSTDCSVRNDRICDTSQPGGYCTIPNCKTGDCGDDGVCVRFRPQEPRLSTTFCMAKCDKTKDCDRDRYACRSAEQVNENAVDSTGDLAEVLDGSGNAKFCILKD